MGSPQSAILAAGGIVVRHDADGDKIAIVQRRRYPGEMALPKGKIEEWEAIPAAAQRKTSEETGCEVTDPRFAGAVHYLVGVAPKVVFFYLMELVREDPAGPKDTREIEAVKWMSPAAAVKALTHADVRRLITDIFGLFPFQVQATTSIAATITRVCWGAFGSPGKRLGLQPWEGPGGFRVDAFVRPIYRREETARFRTAPTRKPKQNRKHR